MDDTSLPGASPRNLVLHTIGGIVYVRAVDEVITVEEVGVMAVSTGRENHSAELVHLGRGQAMPAHGPQQGL